jgi:hypothetical protein
MPFVVEVRVVADVGLHLVWVSGVTFCRSLMVDHGHSCCWMHERWQTVLLVYAVDGQTGTRDAVSGS